MQPTDLLLRCENVNAYCSCEQGKITGIRGYDRRSMSASCESNKSIVLKLSPFVTVPILCVANLLNEFAGFPPV